MNTPFNTSLSPFYDAIGITFFLTFWGDKLNRTELSQVLRQRSLAGLTISNELLLHVCSGYNSLKTSMNFTDSPSPQRRCLNRVPYLK